MSSFDVHPVSCNQIYPIEEQTFSCNSTEGLLVTWNIKNLFDICPAQYLDIHINIQQQEPELSLLLVWILLPKAAKKQRFAWKYFVHWDKFICCQPKISTAFHTREARRRPRKARRQTHQRTLGVDRWHWWMMLVNDERWQMYINSNYYILEVYGPYGPDF